MFRNITVALLCVAQCACTSFQPLQRVDAASVQDAVEVGDEVVVTTQQDKTYRFTVTEKTAEHLVGRRAKMRYRVAYENIRALDVRAADAGKTVSGVGTTIFGTAAVAFAVLSAIGLVILIDLESDD